MTEACMKFEPKNFSLFQVSFNTAHPVFCRLFRTLLIEMSLTSPLIHFVRIKDVGLLFTSAFIKEYPEYFAKIETPKRTMIFCLESDVVIHEFLGGHLTNPSEILHSHYWRHERSIPIMKFQEISFRKNQGGSSYELKITVMN